MIYYTKNKVKEIKKVNNSNAGIEMIKFIKYYEEFDPNFKKFREKEAEKEKNINERSQRSLRRTRKNIQDILNSNLDNNSYFLTLTFAENITDYEKANSKFNYYIRQKNKDIKYLAVKEHQKRGAIHFHLVVFDIQPNEMIELLNSWTYGFKSYKHIKNKYSYSIANYLTKYLTKEKNQLVQKRKRVFSKSTNLKKPLVISNEIIDEILEKYNYNVDLTKYDWSKHEYNIKERVNSNLAVSIKEKGKPM